MLSRTCLKLYDMGLGIIRMFETAYLLILCRKNIFLEHNLWREHIMYIKRGYRAELDLNHKQITACKKHAGAARYAYNYGLRRKQEVYRATGRSISAMELHREINVLKQTELGWMHEVSKCAPQEALRDLDKAFTHFFRRVRLKKEGKWKGLAGYPRFKSKKKGLGSFRLTGAIHILEKAVQLPRLGRLRLKEAGYLPTTGVKIFSATISEQAGHWFVSIQVIEDVLDPIPATGEPIGVDLGIKSLAVCSDDREPIANPKPCAPTSKNSFAPSVVSPGAKRAGKIGRRPANCLPVTIIALPLSDVTPSTRLPQGLLTLAFEG